MWQAREDRTLGQSPVVSTGLGPIAFGALGSSLHKNQQNQVWVSAGPVALGEPGPIII
jgi:hypothetical protein